MGPSYLEQHFGDFNMRLSSDYKGTVFSSLYDPYSRTRELEHHHLDPLWQV